jgi:uncharacterized alkaline shock family protein YloU
MAEFDNKAFDIQETADQVATQPEELAVEAVNDLVADAPADAADEEVAVEAAPEPDEAEVSDDAIDDEGEDVPDEDDDLDDEDDDLDDEDDDLDDEDVDSEDSLTFSNGVIEKIVALAVRDVPGVVGMKGGWINRLQDAFGATDTRKGVTVEVTPESAVRVNVSVLMEYGAYAPQVFEDVKKAVVKQISGMTGLAVAGVNLRIEDVLTPEEVAERYADRLSAAAPYDEPDLLEE